MTPEDALKTVLSKLDECGDLGVVDLVERLFLEME